ncbi:NADAR family protein [Dechloromonas sp. A34]|uniref:NADAR family protein n=1 Tax=Dechloromonas sp. A34 TaxID=447588 RepID=UPI00224882D0|nr:NADAR family protein [Dechloromonas sp. A34]
MKTYNKNEVVSFLTTREAFGGLSNMAPGYLITLYGNRCRTSEHLYQALKFPNHPEIQSEILEKPSPMGAKMVAKRREYRPLIRPDWEEIKLSVMDYCLRAKLKCNFQRFGDLLLSTGNADIVEVSSKHDTYWGCVPDGEILVGHNHLGVQLTNLRDELLREGAGAGHRMKLTPPAGVELRFNGRTVGEFPFGVWDETTFDEFRAAIRTKHTNRLPSSTIGGN